MIKNILLTFILISSLQVQSQLFAPDSTGFDYYKRGTEALHSKNYIVAETLLTLSLDKYRNANVYFNRALARIMIQDTIGFCEDMDYAVNKYFDSEADVYYNRICCDRVDTIYYNKKRKVSNVDKYRYYEIIKKPKYNNKTIGTYHDIKSWKTVMAFDMNYGDGFQAFGKESNLIAAYFLEDDKKCYYKTTTPYSFNDEEKYFKFINDAKRQLSYKYSYLKNNNDIESLAVMYKVYYNKKGTAYKIELVATISDGVNFEIKEIDQNKILNDIRKCYPVVIPAKFFKEDVSYVTLDLIEI